MVGRPKVLTAPRPLCLVVEKADYEALAVELLPAYRKAHPRATLGALARDLLRQAIQQYRHRDAERRGTADRERRERQRELRRLAVSMAAAPDDRLEATAARLAAMVKRD